jgi:hypothetical protein
MKLFILIFLFTTLTLGARLQALQDNSPPASISPRSHDDRQRVEAENPRSGRGLPEKQNERPLSEVLKDWGSFVQSVATVLSFIVGGWWVYIKFVRAQEKYPNIEFSADINIIGQQNGFLIVELIAYVENKGKAQHQMQDFNFDLNALFPQDPILPDQRWGGQIDFPHPICSGSFLPARSKFFFVDPGTTAKYSYIAGVPKETSFLILHCRFEYTNRGRTAHTAEKTIRVPKTVTP